MKNTKQTFSMIFLGLQQIEGENFKRAVLSKIAKRTDGKTRPVGINVIVKDERLLDRLQSEIKTGDVIEVTTETFWNEEKMPTYLLDFEVESVQVREAA